MPDQILDEHGVSKVEAIKGINAIRMGLYRKKAAIFFPNKEGIILLNDHGDQVGFLTHPGKGMETNMVDNAGEPLRRNVQWDVAVNDREGYVLVADTMNRKFWFVGFDNTLIGQAEMPFPVFCITLTEDHIYLLGQEGKFG